jgi:hypothetical protein
MKNVLASLCVLLLAGTALIGGSAADRAAAQDQQLRITRVEMAFADRRSQPIVPRRTTALQAVADIAFTGAGRLEACWLVDGVFFAESASFLTGARRIRIASPETPGLPTLAEGLHIVTLDLKTPGREIPPTRVSYFVATDKKALYPLIVLTGPADRSAIDPAAQPFTWEGLPAAKTYLIEWIDDNPGRPLAAAFTDTTRYTLPAPVALYRFRPGRTYYWRVKGFSADHNVITESLPRRFRMTGGQAKHTE